jgi:3-oxoacyl-[acyl-carrier protein] reductase
VAANHLLDGGAIVNIASIEGSFAAWGHSHYSAAKAAVIMYTQSAALELGGRGIRVNCVSPGLIWREGIETAWADGVARWQARAPLTRLGMPDDIADACLFLASPAARWITGVNLTVDGGVSSSPAF